MKKQISVMLVIFILITALPGTWAICADTSVQGLAIGFNGETVNRTSVILNNTHYVPLRPVFEKMGAFVFYRESDRQILALSRDGDSIRHIIGSNSINVNGKDLTFENSSVLKSDGTYIPQDMMSAAMNPDRILYGNQKLEIQKYLFNNDYHKIIKDVLDVCKSTNFYPERFQRYIDYHVKKPDLNMRDVILRVNIGLDNSFYSNLTTVENPYDLYVLVNKYNRLPSNFEQYNLVTMDKEYTVNDGKQYLLAGVAYEKYKEMHNASKSDGVAMRVISAYRNESYQRNLYNNRVQTTGKTNADNYSARAGHSEHQTGLAVDISSDKGSFEYTPEFKWLQKHAHEYGYILRYPKGKEWITGYSYEPWHYRYIGVDAAKIIYETGITYEEYYALYAATSEFK